MTRITKSKLLAASCALALGALAFPGLTALAANDAAIGSGDGSKIDDAVPAPDVTEAACPGDVNGDQFVDLTDILEVLASFGPCPDFADQGGRGPGSDNDPGVNDQGLAGCPKDLNHDGVVDIGDVLMVLAEWGACP